MSESRNNLLQSPHRLVMVVAVFAVLALLLAWRAAYLHVFNRDFLQHQGDARYLRVVDIAAHRGMITDRTGEPLAISTPVDSVWANPQLLADERNRWADLAEVLGMQRADLERLIGQRMDREFVYLRRHVPPDVAEQVKALDIAGVALQREYRRYYPTGEVAAHLVGFTDVDDNGIEGMELAYDEWLRGTPGAKRVIKDRLGRVVENVESIREPRPGRDLRLSIDRRLQYLAYRELKTAVQRHQAVSGSLVLLDARTGEVLAMVNQPAYNPNNRRQRGGARSRNRAVTDLFEPGSTIKPFTIAAALESGLFRPDTTIDTSPGYLRLDGSIIRDHRNYGLIDVATVVQKSSNVGASRIALELEPSNQLRLLEKAGFGTPPGSGFPGEASGLLSYRDRWKAIERATLSYGYGMSVSALQLVQSYTVFANEGRLIPVTMTVREAGERPEGIRTMAPETARAVLDMLHRVVEPGGTGTQAGVAGYTVGGKTGTAHKVMAGGGYSDDKYLAVFAGVAPVNQPRLVMAVVIDEPSTEEYYGGEVAAPVFRAVMAGALRLLDIPPDDLESLGGRMASAEGVL